MTQIEKQINKDDLEAWKRYDNNQYSLIPGFSTNKKLLEHPLTDGTSPLQDKRGSKASPEILARDRDRLASYGFTHVSPNNVSQGRN
jgi:hypothetical protein